MATVTQTLPTPANVESASVTPAALPPPGQPDIAYAPDYEKWQARVARRLAEEGENLPRTLPPGFPAQLSGKLVWEGENLAKTYDWTYVLSGEQLREIDEAVGYFEALNLPLGHVSRQTFPLPTLHAELRRLSRDELHNGHGFFVIRGVPVDKYTRWDNALVYAGISTHVADRWGRQDHKFEGRPADVVMTHIKDLSGQLLNGPNKNSSGGFIGSPAYTTDKQVFHTDAGDIVSLFALETALRGGASKLASVWRVYNEIARTRPDLVHTLAGEWVAQVYEGGRSQATLPLLFHEPADLSAKRPERIYLEYARRHFVGFGALPRSRELPPISEAQAEALDTLNFLGERFCVNTEFEKGDIQYVNNLAVFHARDGFVDGEGKHRHLLRLWLRDSEHAWATPAPLRARWEQLYEAVTPESAVLPLEPYVRSASNSAR